MRNEVPPGQVRAWEQLTVAVLALGAVSVIASVATALLPTSSSPFQQVVDVLIDAAFVVFVVAGLVWRWLTRRFRRALHDDEGDRRFAIAWVIAVAVFIVADCAMAKAVGGPDPVHRLQVLGAGARFLWAVIVVIVVVTMHRDMRNVLAGVPRDAPREAGGAVRFQLVLPSRVSDFVAGTRGAHRADLYPSDDPAARTAVTAAEQAA